METIKKGIHDADAEARSVARQWVPSVHLIIVLIITQDFKITRVKSFCLMLTKWCQSLL